MPIDPSIALGVRAPQFADPLQQYGNVLAIQNAGNQNALSQYTLARAKREDETQNALAAAYRDAITPDGKIDYNRLTQSLAGGAAATSIPGVIKGRQEEEKRALDSKNILSQISERDTNERIKRVDAIARQLVGAKTDEEVMPVLDMFMKADPQGGAQIRERYIAQRMAGMSPDQLSTQIAMSFSDHALKALQATAPNIDYLNTGTAFVPANKNPHGGPLGPISGAQSVPIGMNPSQASEAINRPFLPSGEVNPQVQEFLLRRARSGAPSTNVYSQTLTPAVDAAGNPVFVQSSGRPDTPPRTVEGVRPMPTASQERSRTEAQQQEQTSKQIRDRIEKMSQILRGGAIAGGVVGPAGMASRAAETVSGVIGKDDKTPAIDFKNEQALLLADVRKMVEKDPNLSKDERERLYETLGGGFIQTPQSSLRALRNIVDYVENKKIAPSNNRRSTDIPPPEQREKGRTYTTPRGAMEWTGTGWLPKN